MQILLALIFGAAYGAALHYLMPGRDTRGAALAPLSGTVLGGATWLILTWAGLTIETPWIWLASVAVPAIVVPLGLIALHRRRQEHDLRERERLGIA